MKLDVWTHVMPPSYAALLEEHNVGQFFMSQRTLHDIDFRLEVIDRYEDYQQILTPLMAPEYFPGAQFNDEASQAGLADLVRRSNEEMAELVAQHDRFAGFAAATRLRDPDLATEEAIRCVRDLGALGVQLEVDPINLPLDDERYEPLFAAMEELGAGVWLHPARLPGTVGAPAETAPFLLWQVFGWPFDSTITIARLILAGIYDRHPDLKLIAHHGGGVIPLLGGRIAIMPKYGNLDPSGSLGGQIESLKRSLDEYFQMLYVDTAMFGAQTSVQCVVDFFEPDHVLFGTDFPWDTQDGTAFIPNTISDIEGVTEPDATRQAIFEDNAKRLLKV